MDRLSEGSLTVDNSACRQTSEDIYSPCQRQLITFDMLHDDVLLRIFDFYLGEDMGENHELQRVQDWITLVHVCRRWRNLVFQSQRRLDLGLLCTHQTRVRDTLDTWPPLPLTIHNSNININDRPPEMDNIIAALEHNDRVHRIRLGRLSSEELGSLIDSPAMQKPFPELTELQLGMVIYGRPERILPDSFLGGTAPRLRSLYLEFLPFPGLPKLLLTATNLVHLYLSEIPRPDCFPPEAMATSLSALTNLEALALHFQWHIDRPSIPASESRSPSPPPPPPARSILPSLVTILFRGTREYLEEILARIDAPPLDHFHITFSHLITSDAPQLFQFISRRRPALRAPEKGYIAFASRFIVVKFQSRASDRRGLSVHIPCAGTAASQLSSLKQFCTSSFPPVFTLEDLHIVEHRERQPGWRYDIQPRKALWLEFLRPFTSVKNLYISKEMVPNFAPALWELVGDRTTEALPALENVFFEGLPSGPLREKIETFVATRQLAGHPVAVSRWKRNPQENTDKFWYGTGI